MQAIIKYANIFTYLLIYLVVRKISNDIAFNLFQVNTLKDQLGKEMQQKQSFIARTSQKSDEIKDIRAKLNDSLINVAREPAVLDRESMKLDQTADQLSGIDTSGTNFPTSTPYYGNTRRTKSTSPNTSYISPEKMKMSTITMTPTTDPGISPTKRSTPITAGLRKSGMAPRSSVSSSIGRSKKDYQ